MAFSAKGHGEKSGSCDTALKQSRSGGQKVAKRWRLADARSARRSQQKPTVSYSSMGVLNF